MLAQVRGTAKGLIGAICREVAKDIFGRGLLRPISQFVKGPLIGRFGQTHFADLGLVVGDHRHNWLGNEGEPVLLAFMAVGRIGTSKEIGVQVIARAFG